VDDHVRAKRLAAELQRHGFDLPRKGQVDTNIVYFALPNGATVSREEFGLRLARDHGVKITGGYSRGGRLFRAVTHLDVNDDDVDRATEAIVKVALGL
jgi:threonine aldolase